MASWHNRQPRLAVEGWSRRVLPTANWERRSRPGRSAILSCSATTTAWIELSDGHGFLAMFVAAGMASRRKPATHRCVFPDEARRWEEVQAAELGASENALRLAHYHIERLDALLPRPPGPSGLPKCGAGANRRPTAFSISRGLTGADMNSPSPSA
jgi:hypothetical protein